MGCEKEFLDETLEIYYSSWMDTGMSDADGRLCDI